MEDVVDGLVEGLITDDNNHHEADLEHQRLLSKPEANAIAVTTSASMDFNASSKMASGRSKVHPSDTDE